MQNMAPLRFESTNDLNLESVYRGNEYLGTVHFFAGRWWAIERTHDRTTGRSSMRGFGQDTKLEAASDLDLFAALHKHEGA